MALPQTPGRPRREPILHLPRVVTLAIIVLLGLHAVRTGLLSQEEDVTTLIDFALVPARWTVAVDPARAEDVLRAAGDGALDQASNLRLALARYVVANAEPAWTTFATYALLHGSWAHVILNAAWLAGFGAPVARRCGAWRFAALLSLGAVAGGAAHVALYPLSVAPLIGASAGVSALTAAAARFVFAPSLRERGLLVDDEIHLRPRQSLAQVLANRRATLFIGVWLLTNALFGALGTPLDVADAGIAWEAHLGGFLAGFVLFPLLDPFARPSDRRTA
jgi:membrane associated rhomboid family serine protease